MSLSTMPKNLEISATTDLSTLFAYSFVFVLLVICGYKILQEYRNVKEEIKACRLSSLKEIETLKNEMYENMKENIEASRLSSLKEIETLKNETETLKKENEMFERYFNAYRKVVDKKFCEHAETFRRRDKEVSRELLKL